MGKIDPVYLEPRRQAEEREFQAELAKFKAWLDEQRPVLENLLLVVEGENVGLIHVASE